MAIDFVCGWECRIADPGRRQTLMNGTGMLPIRHNQHHHRSSFRHGGTTLQRRRRCMDLRKTVARRTVAGRVYIYFATLPNTGPVAVVRHWAQST